MPWEKGKSGNPEGRPRGSRQKLAESFIADIQEDWKASGKEALVKVRTEDPSTYLRVVASILPKEIELEVGQGLAALLGTLGSEPEGAGDVSPVEETGTGAVCH
jgi:hypothetical protein